MSIPRSLSALLLCLALPATGLAASPQGARPATAERSDFWVGVGIGAYEGQDYDRVCANGSNDCRAVGGGSAHLALDYAQGRNRVRLRTAVYTGFTSNAAEETALMVGRPLDPQGRLHLLAGVSRLTDVSADTQAPTVGVPIDLLAYPLRGLELGLHGNFNPDADFVGVSIAWAIGRR